MELTTSPLLSVAWITKLRRAFLVKFLGWQIFWENVNNKFMQCICEISSFHLISYGFTFFFMHSFLWVLYDIWNTTATSIAVRLEWRSHIQTKKQLLAMCKRNTTDSLEKIVSSVSQTLFEFFMFIVSFGSKSSRIYTVWLLQH